MESCLACIMETMNTINYSELQPEAQNYWKWYNNNPIPPVNAAIAKDGAGSEIRTPLMHFGTVLPVYLAVIRYLKAAKLKKGMKLLEMGCGTGRVLSYVASLFPELEVYGVDYSKAVIEYAKTNYKKFGVHYKTADTTKDTFFKDGMFDFVMSSHVLEHVTEEGGHEFIKETYRLLKPGGYAFIGTPERRAAQDMYWKNPDENPKRRLTPPHEHEYTLPEIKKLGEEVFPKGKVHVDQLNNEVFRKIFHDSINKLSPEKGMVNKLRNTMYTTFRDYSPKPVFDTVVKVGLDTQLKSRGLSYKDILFANKVELEKSPSVPDNLFLVCQK